METYFLWASVGILVFFLLIGFLCGLVRGLKRSSLHLIFFVVSIVVAFCITKTVTNAVLNVTITVNGNTQTLNQFIMEALNQQFNLTAYETATQFIGKLPLAIVAPILFILLSLGSFIVFDILYLIISRIAFGKKKKDFKEHKPHRWLGSLVGAVEGFLFLFILFAPLTALTKTYSQIVAVQSEATSAQVLMLSETDLQNGEENQNQNLGEDSGNEPGQNNHLQTIPELLGNNIPKEVNESILAYNNSILGKVCGAGGLDKALFDGLSNFKLNGKKISLRTELLNLADTYNNFVVVYNNYIDKNYTDIDLTKLKANIESFLNNGIFKTVVADTVKDYVVNFQFNSENPDDPTTPKQPTLFEEILLELKQEFSKEEFVAAEYLKADIIQLINTAEQLLKSDLLKDFNNLTEKNMAAIMELVGQNNADAQTIICNVFDLKLVNDAFSPISKFLKDNLKEAKDFVDVSEIENTTTAWKSELSILGDALQVLATNKIAVKVEGTETTVEKTYLAYVLDDGTHADDYMQILFKDMLKEKIIEGEQGEQPTTFIPLAQLLNPVVESKMLSPLVNTIFKEIDNAVESLTGVAQTTNTTNLKETKQETISAIVKIMDFALNLQADETLDLGKIGAVLDVLKENAKAHSTEGKFDGVFNETFVNLIWYMTGDSVDGRTLPPEPAEGQEAAKPNENAKTIKDYLAVKPDDGTNPATFSGYYAFESYEKAMADVQKLLDSTKALMDFKFKDPTNPDDTTVNPTPEQIEEAVEEVVNVFADMGEAQQNALLDVAQEMLGKDGGVLNETQLEEYKDVLEEKLNAFEGKVSQEVANRLKQLLGYDISTTPTNPTQPEENV